MILFTYMFPELLLGIPFFASFKLLGLVNSLYGLALAHVTLSFPFALSLMWPTFQALPPEYEEAAWMDGAGPLRSWVIIRAAALLLAVPGLLLLMVGQRYLVKGFGDGLAN
jgi:multiple sugar transport system permease protein